MIINITKSKLFNINPDERFSKEYSLPLGTWTKVWGQYKLLGYSNGDMRDYLFIKHARNLSYNSIDRWIIRTEIFSIANPLIKKGVQHVKSEIFKEWEQDVMNEILKTLKSGDSTSSKIII